MPRDREGFDEGCGLDEGLWLLALDGDAGSLDEAAQLLSERYEGQRARAFALALAGERDHALMALGAGWTTQWPLPVAYAVDVARVHLLASDPAGALAALRLGLAGTPSLTRQMRDAIGGCVRARRSLWRLGVRVAVGGGSMGDRLLAVLAVLRALVQPRKGRCWAASGQRSR